MFVAVSVCVIHNCVCMTASMYDVANFIGMPESNNFLICIDSRTVSIMNQRLKLNYNELRRITF